MGVLQGHILDVYLPGAKFCTANERGQITLWAVDTRGRPQETASESTWAPPQPPSQITYSVKQAAERLGMPDNKVRQLVNAGEIAAGKVGKSYRISAEALDDYATAITTAGLPE